jgi:hypothetical protein
MANDLIKHSAGVTENGIDVFNPDFNPRLVLAATSYNMMTGINRGTGPRYGISPIPGHSSKDVTTANGRGIRSAELSTGSATDVFNNRYKFLGVFPVSFSSYDDIDVKGNIFLWLIADYVSSKYVLTSTPNCTFTDGGAGANTYKHSFDIGYGFYNPIWNQPLGNGAVFTNQEAGYLSPIVRRYAGSNPSNQTVDSFVKSVLELDSSVYYVSAAVISVSGKSWPQKWLIGAKVANGDSTNTATANMIFLNSSRNFTCGLNPGWNLGNYKKSIRNLLFYNLDALQLIRTYSYESYQVSNSTYVSTFNQDYSTANYSLSSASTAQQASLAGRAFVAADIDNVLMKDEELTCDSSYTIQLVAAKKPLAYIVQPHERDYSGRVVQAVSLTDRQHAPDIRTTYEEAGGGTYYTEDGIRTNTCWDNWPLFLSNYYLVKDSDLANTTGNIHVTLGDAGSGVLRANTIYEFTFSIFDKQLGIETNVGKPAKIRTQSDDFVAITMLRDYYSGGVYQQVCPASTLSPFNLNHWFKYDGTNYYYNNIVNMLEIRIYYRPLGSYEWLPALFMDMAEYLFNPDYRKKWACTGDIAALPGGQPGGFIDYSYLPDDQYDCVVNFRNRAFWLSEKNLVFSLANNPFAYPLRNSAPAPTGGYRGAIVHTYRGQSDQESRLIVFGQKETYIGKFTGVYTQQPVRVSSDTVATYDVDGSDFRIEPWTSITAFSHRAAVVADGDLYFWGPQGVYKDNGVGNPVKISDGMEPDIFSLYDQSLTAEIHCIYDEKTKHIIWFYPPAEANTITYSLTYEIATGQFFIDRFKCKIDWAQRVSTNNSSVTSKTNSLRTIIGSRKSSSETIQRGFFFDQINRSGDWSPERELLAKSVASGSTSLERVLDFDSGLDATNFATIAVGDKIAIQQFKAYTGQATGDDLIATVSAINTGANTLTIKLPENATLPTYTAGSEKAYFPIWHAAASGDGLNGIPWVWETKYWMPEGINYQGLWLYLYLFIKYTTWKKRPANTFSVGYRTPTSGSMISDTITMLDNSDGNFQLFHMLRNVLTTNQGQAIKFKLSGTHIGEEWMLQYLEAHALEQGGNILKQFEG